MQYYVPEHSLIHFETVLEPTARTVNKGQPGEGEINILRGKKNKLGVSVYDYGNLITKMQEQNQKVSIDLEINKNKYDFYYSVLACSFLPDNDCRFDWARLGIELSSSSNSGNPTVKPLAHFLFPNEVNSEIRYKREISFTPELKAKLFEVVDAGVAANVSNSREYVTYEPQVFSFGIGKSVLGWNFSKTKEKGIMGDKILFLVVKAPKGNKVKGKFLVGAEVSSSLSNWLPIPVSKRKDDAVKIEYDLSG